MAQITHGLKSLTSVFVLLGLIGFDWLRSEFLSIHLIRLGWEKNKKNITKNVGWTLFISKEWPINIKHETHRDKKDENSPGMFKKKTGFNSFLLSTPVNIPKKDDRQNCICKIHPTY